jgi:hypothetical protein
VTKGRLAEPKMRVGRESEVRMLCGMFAWARAALSDNGTLSRPTGLQGLNWRRRRFSPVDEQVGGAGRENEQGLIPKYVG